MPVSGVSHLIEHRTGWSIKKFVRTARRYRTVRIQAGRQILTAAEPVPTTSHKHSPRSTRPPVAHQPIEVGCQHWQDEIVYLHIERQRALDQHLSRDRSREQSPDYGLEL